MQDRFAVGVIHSLGDASQVLGRPRRGQRPVPDELRQIFAFHIVHGEEMLAFLHAHLVNGDDVRVLQFGGRRRFALKALDELLTGERTGQHHFERHDPSQAPLPGFVNDRAFPMSRPRGRPVWYNYRQRLARK